MFQTEYFDFLGFQILYSENTVMNCETHLNMLNGHPWCLIDGNYIQLLFQCAHHYCEGQEEHNNRVIRDFVSDYGNVGHTFKCYYNTEDAREAIVSPYLSHTDLTTNLLLPGVPMGISILGLLILLVWKGPRAMSPVNLRSCEHWVTS